MRNLRRGSKELIKDINRALVIEEIRVKGPISRTAIARNTDLGLSTITNIVEELMKENLVCEYGAGTSQGGRKPILLRYNGQFGLVAGIKLENKQILFCAADLNATILFKSRVSYDSHTTGEQIQSIIIAEVRQIVDRFGPGYTFCGIGIATSGLIDRGGKRLIYSPILTWKDVDLGSVGEHFQVPVFIDNDANVFALAQMWIGVAKQYTNFVGITVGIGVGAGIVINGEIFRGELGGAGELGHMIIEKNGLMCHCGQRGCLEAYAGDRFLIREARSIIAQGIPTQLSGYSKITPESVYEAADNGDLVAQEILFTQGENLGIGLKNLVHLMNPAAIILGGEGLRGKEYMLQGLEKELASHFFTPHEQKLHFHVSDIGEDDWLIGACALVVKDLFKAPLYR